MKNKIFKNLSGKLSAIALATCCLLSLGGVDNLSAKAASEYPMTVENYDGTDYAGVRIDKNNVDSFNETIDLSNCDLDTPLFQFVITPSQRGNGKVYTPDFEKLAFTLTDSTGKAVSVSFSPRKADAPRWYYLCGFAAGQNQTLLGEHHNNFRYLTNEVDNCAYLTDVYASISPYTFDGYGADFSYFAFYDKAGNKAVAGQNGMIGVYYDREENAIYADMGWQWVDDDETQPWTLTDKFKLAPNGERRWRIRDLDKADYTKGNKDNKVSALWDGFEDLSNVTFKMTFGDKKNDNYSILLTSLYGKTLTGNYYLSYENKGLVNKQIAVPQPSYFSNVKSYDFVELGGKFSIKDPLGNTVVSETAYSTSANFIPTMVGDYTVEYSVQDPNEKVEKTYTLPITVLEKGGSSLVLNAVERDYLLYDEIDVGYQLISNIQTVLPDVFVTVYKDGETLVSKKKCPSNFKYFFEKEGEYTFEYETTDYLGQTIVQSFSCKVNGIAVKLNDGIAYSALYNNASELVLPTANDFLLINALNGAKINPTKVDIKVRLGDGEWSALNAGVFSTEGTYEILYEYHCDGKIVAAERQIAIYAAFPTIQVEKAPQNTRLMQGESLEGDTVKVRALIGTPVVFPYGYFKSTQTMRIEKIIGANVEDVTSLFRSGSYSVTFEEEGEYCISAVITIADTYIIRKSIFIEVKANWIEIQAPERTMASVGQTVSLVEPKAKDFYGNELTGGTYKVMYNGEEVVVENGKFVPQYIGIYTVIYTVFDKSESQSCEYTYYAVDQIAPVIALSNKVVVAHKGENVSLAKVQLTDNSVSDLDYKIVVTYGNDNVSIFNNQFLAEKEGIYTVTITAVDVSGNVSTCSYDVEILPAKTMFGCTSSLSNVSSMVTVGLFTVIILKNKKFKGWKKENE